MKISRRHGLGRALIAVAMTAAMALPIGVATSTVASAGPVSPPTISSFTPTKGSFAGGTSVVITGTGLSGATAVTFGDSPAASFTVDSSTQITAVSPSHAIGREVISVTRGTTVSAPDDFVFQPEITLLHDFFEMEGGFATPFPFLMTAGPDGNIWSTTLTEEFEPGNTYLRLEADGTTTSFTAPVTVGMIQTIIAGSDGYLYSTGTDASIENNAPYNQLLRIATDGTATTIIDPELCDAPSITTGGDGNVWAINQSVCAGANDFTAVRFNPDGTVTSFPVASGTSGFQSGFLFPISENRIFINGGEGDGYILDPEDGSVTTLVPCAQDPSDPLSPINGLIGPDGALWITCYDSDGFFNSGYIARVEIDPSDPDYLEPTYFDSNNTEALIGAPIFMTIGADGNIWVSQISGPAPDGSPLPADLSGQLLRISFPDGYSDPLVEDFDSNVAFALYLGSSADGYMYLNQYSVVLALFLGFYGQNLVACFEATTPECTAIGLEGFDAIAGIYRIDVGTAGAPTLADPTPGTNEMQLSWTAPVNTGAGPITGYRIKYSRFADMSNATVIDTGNTDLSRTITGLSGGDRYYVRIATTNTIATGSYGPIESVELLSGATVPDAPTALIATPVNGSASIAFSAGADGGAAITKYQVKVGNGSWTDVVGTTSPITVTGLTNYATVSIKLRAVNAAGAGAASAGVKVWPRISGPSLTSAAAVGRTSIRAGFAALTPSGGTASHYWVHAYAKGTSTIVGSCRSTVAARKCVIKGLTAYTEYDIAVRGFFTLTGSPTVLPTADSTRQTVRTRS